MLCEESRVLACHVCGRHIGESPQAGAPLTELGEIQHASRALDVHLSRLLEGEVELNRCGDVDDLPNSLRELLATPLRQAESLPRDVAAHGADSTNIRALAAVQRAERTLDAACGLDVVRPPHEHVHVAIGALEKASQHLHAHEARRSGQQQGVALAAPVGVAAVARAHSP